MSKPLACCVCALMFASAPSFAWPLLSVSESNQFVTVSWPVSFPEFTLQATTNLLASSSWFGITNGILVNGEQNYFLTNATGQNLLLFRLTRACATKDLPDALFADDNCDGIDGDIGAAVFVAPNGADTLQAGAMQSPFRTISYAIQRAQTLGKSQVLIQAGVYSESIEIVNGIGLYGGYDVNWVRGPHTLAGHEVTIQGGFNSTQQQFITLSVSDSKTNEVTDLEIIGPMATTNGLSSYAVYVRQSRLMLNRVTITAGLGAAGQTGANGSDALLTEAQPSMNGAYGGKAAQYVVSCDNTSRGAGGSAGSNGGSALGGVGGAGGTMDTSCITNIFGTSCSDCTATPGQNGGNADLVVGPYGQGGFGGNASGSPAQPGQNGVVSNGSAGSKGNGYQLQGNFFFTRSGSAGAIGQDGGGGGGGGGSGGNDNGTDSYGAGGGGGGAGGLAARGGGLGGQGGGGSFGVFAVNSAVGLTNATITLGSGGNGGVGGIGGRGQSGGQGGLGGSAAGSSPVGGNGGHGGHGGHGGGGGGGQGGYSVGIAFYNSNLSANSVLFSGGAAGLGGLGGASAPTAPVGEQDGNAGQAGLAGVLTNSLSLSLFFP